MPPIVLSAIIFASAALSFPFSLLTRRLAKKKKLAPSLLLFCTLSLLMWCTSAAAFIFYSPFYGILTLFILDIPVTLNLAVLITVRLKLHIPAEAKYKEQHKKDPRVVTTAEFRETLRGFSTKFPLSAELQQEIIIRLYDGVSIKKLAGEYNCRPIDIKYIKAQFELFKRRKKHTRSGEDYSVSSEQNSLFLQLMVTSTPKSLSCGDFLLWNRESTRRLIYNASKITLSDNALDKFFTENKLLIPENAVAYAMGASFEAWRQSEYKKIRLSALENRALIFWIYTVHPEIKDGGTKKHTMLAAVSQNGSYVFGIYKGSGGFSDFINKLAQENHSKIYAVLTDNCKKYKELQNIASDITLFALGEKALFPEASYL